MGEGRPESRKGSLVWLFISIILVPMGLVLLYLYGVLNLANLLGVRRVAPDRESTPTSRIEGVDRLVFGGIGFVRLRDMETGEEYLASTNGGIIKLEDRNRGRVEKE